MMNERLVIIFFILLIALGFAYWLDVKRELQEVEKENMNYLGDKTNYENR